MQDAAAGKLFYPAKTTVPKKEEPVAAPRPQFAGAPSSRYAQRRREVAQS